MFAFYTCVYNFANYRVPFTKFLINVLKFHKIHISQVIPFGLSQIKHFELSCVALGRMTDLNVFWYFNEFRSTRDW
ncbi:hypothetical protein Hanom_Chr05g00461321 [Helianthus anomalus]